MSRPSGACTSCGKRLGKKHWYYRNGQYFCKKSCWKTTADKAKEEQSKPTADKPPAEPLPSAPNA